MAMLIARTFAGGSSPTAGNIKEPSVSYSDFLTKLNSDQVSFVEFLAPNGDVAYATFKQSTGDGSSSSGNMEPIRIGEGYPLEVSSYNYRIDLFDHHLAYQHSNTYQQSGPRGMEQSSFCDQGSCQKGCTLQIRRSGD